MKLLSLTFACSLLLGISTAASASILSSLNVPELADIKENVQGVCPPGDLCATVEPWVEAVFTYSSCAEQEFQALTGEVEVEDGSDVYRVVTVMIVNNSKTDCEALPKERSYAIPIDDVYHPSTVYNFINLPTK